jgi:hypothetical protein
MFNGTGKLRQPGREGTGNHKKGSSLKWVKQLCYTFALEPFGNIEVEEGKKPSFTESSWNAEELAGERRVGFGDARATRDLRGCDPREACWSKPNSTKNWPFKVMQFECGKGAKNMTAVFELPERHNCSSQATWLNNTTCSQFCPGNERL